MDIELGNPKANFDKVLTLTNKITQIKEKPDVIVLPELWTTGYSFNNIKDMVSEEGKESANF